MTVIAALVGLMMMGLGGTLAAKPDWFRQIVPRWVTPAGLLGISALRLLIGILLLLAASATRLPSLLYVVGGLSLISGLTTPFIGMDRARRFVEWWVRRPDLILRLWAAAAVLIGLAIVWASIA
jgi:hypothetical protein